MNYISMQDDGYIALYFDDDDKPTIEDGLVVVTLIDNVWDAEEDDDWDVTLMDGLEEE
jgi:hypothetical protein